jgi:hypothetical protein
MSRIRSRAVQVCGFGERASLETDIRAAGRTTMSRALFKCGHGVLRTDGGWRAARRSLWTHPVSFAMSAGG